MKNVNFKRASVLIVALSLLCVLFAMSTLTSRADEPIFDHVELKVGDTIGLVYYTTYEYSGTTNSANVFLRYKVGNRAAEEMVRAYPNDNLCVFMLSDIYPHELGQEITATIVLKNANGSYTDIATLSGISIKSELLKMLSDPTQSADNYKFASNLLQYGEQTRLYRNVYSTDPHLQDDRSILDFDTNIYTNYQPDSIYTMYNRNPAGLGMSASRIRMSAIGVSYHDTNHFVVTVKTPTGGATNLASVKVLINGTPFSLADSATKKIDENTYEVTSHAINAFAIPNAVTVDLEVNGAVVQQATYSVADYCYQLEQTTEQRSLAQNYAKSLLVYGQAAAKAYKDNRVVAMQLENRPNDITIGNTQSQTPTGGSATVWYSDGSTGDVTPTWTGVAGITDDTYTVTRNTTGSYYDAQSGKTYTVAATVTLVNPITKIETWVDPSAYAPSAYASTYDPNVNTCGARIRCTWSNTYKSIRTPDDISSVSIPKLTEYQTFTCTATYTNPKKSDDTHTCTMTLLYKNPIKTLTVANSSVSFDDGDFNQSAIPNATTYTLKFTDGQTTSAYNTTATNTLGTFSWTAATYSGTATSGKISSSTGLTTNATFTGTAMPSVTLKTGCTHTTGNACTCLRPGTTTPTAAAVQRTATCKLDFSNPEKYITITKKPQATVDSTAAPTTANGKLTGGETKVTLANGQSCVASGVTYAANAGHTSTAYKVEVTVTASYHSLKGSDGKACTTKIDLLNDIVRVSQRTVPTVDAAHYEDAGVQLTHTNTVLNGTLTAYYQNGKYATVNVTNILVGGAQSNTCYISNITDDSEQTVTRNTASTSSTMDASYTGALQVQHVDKRTGAPGTSQKCAYSVKVKNTATSFIGNGAQMLDRYTMTASSPSSITPTGTMVVELTNKKTKSVTATYGTVTTISTADEYAKRTASASYTSPNGSAITSTAQVLIVNPVTQITRYTDPTPIQVENKNAVAASAVSGGEVTVHYTNGKTKNDVAPSSYELSDVKITDSTLIKRFSITAKYNTKYSGTKDCTLYLILKNPSVSASAANPASKKLSSSGQTVAATTVTITYANGATSTGTSAQWGTLYKTGTASDGTGTTHTRGSCDYSQKYTVAASSALQRYVDGAATNVSLAAKEHTITVTQSWTNPVTKVVAVSASATVAKDKSSGNVTPTGEIKATFANGRQKNYTSHRDLSWSAVQTVTDNSASVTRKTKATFCGVTSSEINCVVYNPPTTLAPASHECRLTSDGWHATGSSGVLTRKNGKQAVVTYTSTVIGQTPGVEVQSSGTTYCKVKYTGSKADAEAARTGSYTCSVTGENVTFSDTLIVVNSPKVITSYSSSPNATRTNNYACYATTTSDKVTPTVSYVVYGANGKPLTSYAVTLKGSTTIYNVEYAYLFRNQGTGAHTDNWGASCAKAVTYTYTLPAYASTTGAKYDVGVTISTYSYNPISSYSFTDTAMNYTKGSAYGIRADFFTVTIARVAVYYNTAKKTETSQTYSWTPSSSTLFRWGLSTSNSSTWTWDSSAWGYKSSLSSTFSSYSSSDNGKYELWSSVRERTNLVGTGAKAWSVAYNKSGYRCYAYVGIKFKDSYTIGGESCSKSAYSSGDYVTRFYRINANNSDVL